MSNGAGKESWGIGASSTVRGRLPQLDGVSPLLARAPDAVCVKRVFCESQVRPPFPLDRRYRMNWASCAHGPIGRRDDDFLGNPPLELLL
jgi:hypothetical protein